MEELGHQGAEGGLVSWENAGMLLCMLANLIDGKSTGRYLKAYTVLRLRAIRYEVIWELLGLREEILGTDPRAVKDDYDGGILDDEVCTAEEFSGVAWGLVQGLIELTPLLAGS